MKVFTIGFTRKSAEEFFTKLGRPGLQRLLDIRLNNSSQLAGFTKRDDLRYFCRVIHGMEYLHLPELAPTPELLQEYKEGGDWLRYEASFQQLLEHRRIDQILSRDLLSGGCLLCSEPTPEHCHRRLVAEYLMQKWRDVEIEHIL